MSLDFSDQDLRGHNFKGQNLSRANFSNTDLRGENFTKAILRGTDFSYSKTGLQSYQLAYAIAASSITIFLIGLIFYIVGFSVNSLLNVQNIKTISSVGIFFGGILLIVFLPIFHNAHLEVKETRTRG